MTRRFFAMTLFIGVLAAASHARANDFTEHFTFAKPPIALPTFTFHDAKDQTLDLKNFKGRYVLLNIWATWCGPCAREMPTLDALAQKFSTGTATPAKSVTISTKIADTPRLEIVAVSEDHDGVDAAQGFFRRHSLHYLNVYADIGGSIPNILQIRGLPTTLLVGPDGKEIGRFEGETDWNDPATIAFLEAQIKPAS